MNKDVIYIEPNDDITDIVSKIENAKERIVAIVPPKKADVFLSIVNIKLIAKTGAKTEKTIVFVTTEPAILRLAAVTRMLVTKDLQTAPSIPNIEEVSINAVSEGVIEDKSTETKEEKTEEKSGQEEKIKKEEKLEEKKSDKKAGKNAFVRWINSYKKMLIFGGATAVVLALFLVWAFVIAPSATITIEVRTTKNNFSESISLTTNLAEENASEGVFYLDSEKSETTQEKNFTATGKKNTGEKSTGELVIYAYFREKGSKTINANNEFTLSGLKYLANNEVTLSWDGINADACDNKDNATQMFTYGCLISARVSVTASEPGEKYNAIASKTGWSDTSNTVSVYSDSDMTGGTDNIITIVQQSDIDKIKESLNSNEDKLKESLIESIDDSSIVIKASFKTEVTKIVSTPEVGEEVKENVKPSVEITVTSTINTLDKTKIEEFISSKAKLSEGYKIYSIEDPFVENFTQAEKGYIGKLKTSYTVGAKITENEIVEMVRGKGIGDAQHELKNVEGISTVNIDTSFPWVSSIPNDTNKIFVNLEVK